MKCKTLIGRLIVAILTITLFSCGGETPEYTQEGNNNGNNNGGNNNGGNNNGGNNNGGNNNGGNNNGGDNNGGDNNGGDNEDNRNTINTDIEDFTNVEQNW